VNYLTQLALNLHPLDLCLYVARITGVSHQHLFFFFKWDWGLNSGLCAGATTPVHVGLIILEMGSLELFAKAGLEPLSSRSQPPK
jgi:hypothetical protein